MRAGSRVNFLLTVVPTVLLLSSRRRGGVAPSLQLPAFQQRLFPDSTARGRFPLSGPLAWPSPQPAPFSQPSRLLRGVSRPPGCPRTETRRRPPGAAPALGRQGRELRGGAGLQARSAAACSEPEQRRPRGGLSVRQCWVGGWRVDGGLRRAGEA